MSGLFGGRRRVEEDLERIRAANLPAADKPAQPEQPPDDIDQSPTPDGCSPDAKTTLSFVLAAFSVVLPYVGGFAVMLLALWLLIRLFVR